LKGLLAFGLTRRAIVVLGLLVFIGAGLAAFSRLNIEAYPNPAPVILEITAQAPGLSAEEMERFLLLCRAAFVSGEDSFLQHRAGLLDETAFRSYVASLKGQLTGSRGLRAAWRILSSQFGAVFSGFVDGVMAQISPQPAPDRMAMWRELLREEAERPAQPVGR